MELTSAVLAVRQRLFDDFAFYAEHALKVRSKDGQILPLMLNRAQRRLLEIIEDQIRDEGKVRVVILKGRQMGISTFIEGWIYWWVSQRHAQRAIVVTHEIPATKNLFGMARRYHKHCPDKLRPQADYDSRNELSFGKLDSSYTIGTAGGESVGRSHPITVAHLSEVAFWPKSKAQEIFSGLMDTIPHADGTAAFIESTANGVTGVFYDQWQRAESGESGFIPVFLPWFWDPGYRVKAPKDFVPTPEEEKLVLAHELDNEQLMFRRRKIAEKGLDLFKQEYPCTAEEAFLTSGRPVFDPEVVQGLLEGAHEPIERKMLLGTEWVDHPAGELSIYRAIEASETYSIGADVGAGVRRDYSVAQVFDGNRRQVAVWRSDRHDPDYFGTVLANLGRLYWEARIICERNNHGILTNRVLSKDEEYGNTYTEVVLDKVTDRETTFVGFFTSEKSKPLIVNQLRARLRDREIEIVDETTIKELRSFVVSENGKLEAEKGCHDDCVISLALVDHINLGPWKPIENQDDWYVRMD